MGKWGHWRIGSPEWFSLERFLRSHLAMLPAWKSQLHWSIRWLCGHSALRKALILSSRLRRERFSSPSTQRHIYQNGWLIDSLESIEQVLWITQGGRSNSHPSPSFFSNWRNLPPTIVGAENSNNSPSQPHLGGDQLWLIRCKGKSPRSLWIRFPPW